MAEHALGGVAGRHRAGRVAEMGKRAWSAGILDLMILATSEQQQQWSRAWMIHLYGFEANAEMKRVCRSDSS